MQIKEESPEIKKSFFTGRPYNHQIRNIFHRFEMPLIIRIMLNSGGRKILPFLQIPKKTSICFASQGFFFSQIRIHLFKSLALQAWAFFPFF
jgi:hypothetical protein